MKRFIAILKSVGNAIGAAARWFLNVLGYPFRVVRKTPTRDLLLVLAAGVIFIIAALLFLTVKWQPPLDRYSGQLCIASGCLGAVLVSFSMVGLIK